MKNIAYGAAVVIGTIVLAQVIPRQIALLIGLALLLFREGPLMPSRYSVIYAAVVVVLYMAGAAFLGWLYPLIVAIALLVARWFHLRARNSVGGAGFGGRKAVIIAKWLAAAGALIGVGNVIGGLIGEGGTAPYSSRLSFAATALVLALVAGGAPWWPRLSAHTAGFVVITAGLAGFAATLLWFINTFYFVAVPIWLAASFILLIRPR